MNYFNTIGKVLPIGVSLELLGYGVVTENRSDRWHEHRYWQAEFPMSGQAAMKFIDRTDSIRPGDILLLPPGVKHSFIYSGQTFATWSLKFHVSNFAGENEPRLLKADALTSGISSLLDIALRQHFPESSATTEIEPAHPQYLSRIAIIEYLLAGIISSTYEAGNNEDSILGKRIRGMIAARHGGNVTVEEAAKKFGYTRGHLSLKFKQHYGMPLKRFIDRERAETAKRLLQYSDLNISEIADAAGFPDIFAFSSFFKRQSGYSPSHYIAGRFSKLLQP